MEFSLSGSYCTLRLLDPELHCFSLYQNLKDPALWRYFNCNAYLSEQHMLNYLKVLMRDSSTYYVIC